MIDTSRWLALAVGGLCACLLVVGTATAETWTDASGSFRIEAEFVGVQDKNVLLRKPDGKTVSVPIERLSGESRELARRLYELQRSAAPATAGSRAASSTATVTAAPPAAGLIVLTASTPAAPLKFTPPTPPPVAPLAPFPENASLQETADFVHSQLLAGHPEALWHALPEEIRQAFDAQSFRDQLRPFEQEQAAVYQAFEAIGLQALEVLINKKDFVLNSAAMELVPPELQPNVRKGYDSGVGLFYELMVLSAGRTFVADRSMTVIFNEHGPRVGSHLRTLFTHVPPPPFAMEVDQTSESTGTITLTNGPQPQTIDMVRYAQRWIPTELADRWVEKKATFATDFGADMKAIMAATEEDRQQSMAAIGLVAQMVQGALAPLLAATTQAEFDQAIEQLIAMVGMLQNAS